LHTQRKTDKVKSSNKKHKHSDGSYSDSSSSFIRQVSDLSSSFTTIPISPLAHLTIPSEKNKIKKKEARLIFSLIQGGCAKIK
jgi:hypothetical protein